MVHYLAAPLLSLMNNFHGSLFLSRMLQNGQRMSSLEVLFKQLTGFWLKPFGNGWFDFCVAMETVCLGEQGTVLKILGPIKFS